MPGKCFSPEVADPLFRGFLGKDWALCEMMYSLSNKVDPPCSGLRGVSQKDMSKSFLPELVNGTLFGKRAFAAVI